MAGRGPLRSGSLGERGNALKRKIAIWAIAAALFALGGASALAEQGNGNGHTPLNASLGFNAKADLSGQLEYNSDPNGPFAAFTAHCDGYTSFKLRTSGDGFPKVIVTATCTDQDGATVYLKAQFTDRGEPGSRDSVCIVWSYQQPASHKNAYIHDHGIILTGNIQIHTDPESGLLAADMFATP
jgi:hypothetical protein